MMCLRIQGPDSAGRFVAVAQQKGDLQQFVYDSSKSLVLLNTTECLWPGDIKGVNQGWCRPLPGGIIKNMINGQHIQGNFSLDRHFTARVTPGNLLRVIEM